MRVGCGVVAIVGGLAAFGLTVVTGRAWADCDVGINASANSFVLLYFVLPVLWVLNTVVSGVVFGVVSRVGGRGALLAVPLALSAMAVVAWGWLAWQATPAGYPDPICPGNIPPWWPSWIPV